MSHLYEPRVAHVFSLPVALVSVAWLSLLSDLFNAQLSPERFWREPLSQETLPDSALIPSPFLL